jgi:hypothetical protein
MIFWNTTLDLIWEFGSIETYVDSSQSCFSNSYADMEIRPVDILQSFSNKHTKLQNNHLANLGSKKVETD